MNESTTIFICQILYWSHIFLLFLVFFSVFIYMYVHIFDVEDFFFRENFYRWLFYLCKHLYERVRSCRQKIESKTLGCIETKNNNNNKKKWSQHASIDLCHVGGIRYYSVTRIKIRCVFSSSIIEINGFRL